MLRRLAVQFVLASLALFSGLLSYTAVSAWRNDQQAIARAAARSDKKDDTVLVNPFASAHGTHLVAFVITASDCGWSTRPTTMTALQSVRSRLRAVHGRTHAQVTVVGILLDEQLPDGLRFLARLKKDAPDEVFDQVIIGGSWLNELMVQLGWQRGLARPATPQVVIVRRPVDASSYLNDGLLKVGRDTPVLTLSGQVAILEWMRRGLPMDSLGTPSRAQTDAR
jgi:hypothetical protein